MNNSLTSIVDKVREQNPYKENSDSLTEQGCYLIWENCCNDFAKRLAAQQLQSTPCAGVWSRDWKNPNMPEVFAGRERTTTDKWLYINVRKMPNGQFDIGGDYPYTAEDLIQYGYEYLDPTPSNEQGSDWISVEDQKPPVGTEVDAFNKEWIDEDFNPSGIRIGYMDDNGNFNSAKWDGQQDAYFLTTTGEKDWEGIIEVMPSHWRHRPSPPKPKDNGNTSGK